MLLIIKYNTYTIMELKITELEDNTSNINMPKNIKLTKQNPKKNQISYDDILSNMGMYVKNGKVHIYAKNETIQNETIQNETIQNETIQNEISSNKTIQHPKINNYIYNKYFKDDSKIKKTNPRVPKNMEEYRNMLKQDDIQRERIKKFKNTKLFLYQNTTVNTSARVTDLNKLFKFPQR